MLNKLRYVAVAGLGALALSALVTTQADAQTPKRGGTLTFANPGAPNTLDCHGLASSTLLAALAPMYSTLLRFDPQTYPNIVGDLAASWDISADKLTYSFKLKPGIKFSNGSDFTSADVKATYERLRNPPQGVTSLRASQFAALSSIETPDPLSVVFKLSKQNPQMILYFANPYNCIYNAKRLGEKPDYPATEMLGTGPFKLKEYAPGSSITFVRNENYFNKPLPYLDEVKGIFLVGQGFITAIEGGQVDGAFYQISPANKASISAVRGDKTVFPEASYNVINMIEINNDKPPLNDVRVRRALMLALDRRSGAILFSQVWTGKGYGVLFADGIPLDMSKDEMDKLPGYGADVAANRAEARKLLAEAGQSNLKLTLLNRNIGEPYTTLGVYVVDQLRQIGVTVTNNVVETAAYYGGLAGKNFEIAIDAYATTSSDPNEVLEKYLPDSNVNYTNARDPVLQDLYNKQAFETDFNKRRELVTAFQTRLVDQAHLIPMFRSINMGAMATYVKGWKILPNPVLGIDMRDIWLDK